VIFGLGAALGWGISDLLAAVVTRRIGSRATAVVVQVAGLGGFLVLVVLTTPQWGVTAGDALTLIGSGGLAGTAYFSLYRGLELGPVALVSPIASAFAGVTVLLAVAVGGESLSAQQTIGIELVLVGVLLASTDLRSLRKARQHSRGITFGLAAMAGFGVAAYVGASFTREYGWLPPIVISRTGSLIVIVGTVLVLGRVRAKTSVGAPGRSMERTWTSSRGLALAAVSGIADILAIASFARGSQLGFISIVVAASATFTLIPVAGGIVLFHERPAPNQLVGVALVVAGLLLLGLGG